MWSVNTRSFLYVCSPTTAKRRSVWWAAARRAPRAKLTGPCSAPVSSSASRIADLFFCRVFIMLWLNHRLVKFKLINSHTAIANNYTNYYYYSFLLRQSFSNFNPLLSSFNNSSQNSSATPFTYRFQSSVSKYQPWPWSYPAATARSEVRAANRL